MKIVNYRASVSQVVSHNSKGNKNGGLNVHIFVCVLNIASFLSFRTSQTVRLINVVVYFIVTRKLFYEYLFAFCCQ